VLIGWMMRALEDNPILPAGLLNTRFDGVFDPSEAVELSVGEMASEDLFHLWELLGNEIYHLSVPYIARNVHIESRRLQTEGAAVQERDFDYHELVQEIVR
jgi:hypothetical protein